jgi:outer membrane protein OmpA-like peptidoglycan-associated protein
MSYLNGLGSRSEFASQKVTIDAIPGPISNKRSRVVWKNVKFSFERNQYTQLDKTAGENKQNLEFISNFVRVSPGSLLKLTGHLDNSNAKAQGKDWQAKYAGLAQQESVRRAGTVKDELVSNYGLDATQIETEGKGWNEPLGSDPDSNRRVEVQIFTLE